MDSLGAADVAAGEGEGLGNLPLRKARPWLAGWSKTVPIGCRRRGVATPGLAALQNSRLSKIFCGLQK